MVIVIPTRSLPNLLPTVLRIPLFFLCGILEARSRVIVDGMMMMIKMMSTGNNKEFINTDDILIGGWK